MISKVCRNLAGPPSASPIYPQSISILQEQDMRLNLDNRSSTFLFSVRIFEKKTLKYHHSRSLHLEVHLSINPVQYYFTRTNFAAKNFWSQNCYNLVMCGQTFSIPLANYLLDTSSTCLTAVRREKIYSLTSTTK